jgi:hypothetical protein
VAAALVVIEQEVAVRVESGGDAADLCPVEFDGDAAAANVTGLLGKGREHRFDR